MRCAGAVARGAVKLHLGGTRSGIWVVVAARLVHRVPALGVLADLHPVVLAILHLAGVLQRLGEEVSEVIVVGGVLESKVSHVRQVLVELLREALAQILNRSCLLLLANLLVLLLVGSSLQTLPGQTSSEEVHEDMAKSLEIVTSRLLPTKMRVDTHVTSSSRKRFPLAVGNVLLGLGVSVLLCHAEIDHVDDIGSLGSRSANQKVVRLDISVDQVLLVDRLDS